MGLFFGRELRVLALLGLTVLTVAKLPALPPVTIVPNSTTASGFGYGGDMAIQLHVAFSATIAGVCGFAAKRRNNQLVMRFFSNIPKKNTGIARVPGGNVAYVSSTSIAHYIYVI